MQQEQPKSQAPTIAPTSNINNNNDPFSIFHSDPLLSQFTEPDFSPHTFLSSHFASSTTLSLSSSSLNRAKSKSTLTSTSSKPNFQKFDENDENYDEKNNNDEEEEMSEIQKLEMGLDHVDRQIHELIIRNEHRLIQQTMSLHGHELQVELNAIREHVNELESSVNRLRNRYMIQTEENNEENEKNDEETVENEEKSENGEKSEKFKEKTMKREKMSSSSSSSSFSTMIHQRIVQLRNMIDAVDMMRFVDQVLKILIKIQKTIHLLISSSSKTSGGQNGNEEDDEHQLNYQQFQKWCNQSLNSQVDDVPASMANIALYLNELEVENLLKWRKSTASVSAMNSGSSSSGSVGSGSVVSVSGGSYEATGITVIDEQLESLKWIRSIILQFSCQVLLNGVHSMNQSQISSSCQLFFNMDMLYAVVSEQVLNVFVSRIQKERFIVKQVLSAMNSAHSQRVHLSNVALDDVFEEYRNMIKKVQVLESVLRKKQCLHKGVLLISVVPAPAAVPSTMSPTTTMQANDFAATAVSSATGRSSGTSSSQTPLTDRFWDDVSRLIVGEFSSHQIRSLMQQDSSRQLRTQLYEFVNFVSTYVPNRSQQLDHWVRTCLGSQL